jgi:hypothetical protein
MFKVHITVGGNKRVPPQIWFTKNGNPSVVIRVYLQGDLKSHLYDTKSEHKCHSEFRAE